MPAYWKSATMERWIPVSSKKKRSKQAQKSDSASDHTEADPRQSTPEQLYYPQPVSKRISIGNDFMSMMWYDFSFLLYQK